MKSVLNRLIELKCILVNKPEDGLDYCNKWLAELDNTTKPFLDKKPLVTKIYNDKLRDVWFELSREKTDDKRSL